MKRLLVALCLLLWCSVASAQTVTDQGSANGAVATLNLTVTGNANAQDYIIVFVCDHSVSGITSITDNSGNTYSLITSNTNTTIECYIFGGTGGGLSSGVSVISANKASAAAGGIAALSITNTIPVSGSSPIDAKNTAVGSSTSPSVSITTLQPVDVIIGGVGFALTNSTTFTQDTGHGFAAPFAKNGTTATNPAFEAGGNKLVTSAGSYTYSPTTGTSGNWIAVEIAVKTYQTVNLGTGGSGSGNNAVTTSATAPSGSSIIVSALSSNSGGASCAPGGVPTDAASNTYSLQASQALGTSTTDILCVYAAYNISTLSSGSAITYHGGTASTAVQATNVIGTAASPLDVAFNAGNTSSTGQCNGNFSKITPSAANEIMFNICGWDDAGSGGSTFTQDAVNFQSWNNIPIYAGGSSMAYGGGSYVYNTTTAVDYEPTYTFIGTGNNGFGSEVILALKPIIVTAGGTVIPLRARRGYGN